MCSEKIQVTHEAKKHLISWPYVLFLHCNVFWTFSCLHLNKTKLRRVYKTDNTASFLFSSMRFEITILECTARAPRAPKALTACAQLPWSCPYPAHSPGPTVRAWGPSVPAPVTPQQGQSPAPNSSAPPLHSPVQPQPIPIPRKVPKCWRWGCPDCPSVAW